jgi:hypothetical protein
MNRNVTVPERHTVKSCGGGGERNLHVFQIIQVEWVCLSRRPREGAHYQWTGDSMGARAGISFIILACLRNGGC